MFNLPPVTRGIIIANVLVFLLVAGGGPYVDSLALWPLGPQFQPWQVITYAFVHAGLPHIAFNMLGVGMFGADVERVWGSPRFLNYYLVCAVSAAIAQLAVTSLTGAYYPTVGASGALFGLLLAFARLFPNRIIIPLIPPIPMRAPVFVAVFGALELLLGVTGTLAGIAHFAHLGGLAGGWLYLRFGPRRR